MDGQKTGSLRGKGNMAVANRWTQKLAESGWTPVVHTFLDRYAELGLSTSEAMVIIQLIRHKWRDDLPYPKAAVIARHMGIQAPAVRNHIRSLSDRKLVRRIFQPGGPSRYDMSPLFERLESLPVRKKKTVMIELEIEDESGAQL